MKFPRAYKGVKKVFIGELLEIVSAIAALVSSVLAALVTEGKLPEVVAAAVAGVALAAGIIAIIAFIIQMIGLFQAGFDENSFRTAFWTVLFTIALSIASVILSSFPVTKIAADVVDTLITVLRLFVVLFILNGIVVLAQRLNNEAMASEGRLLAFILIALFGISAILNIIPVFFGSVDWAAKVSAIIAIVVSVLQFITYIIFVVYLGRATRMLKK